MKQKQRCDDLKCLTVGQYLTELLLLAPFLRTLCFQCLLLVRYSWGRYRVMRRGLDKHVS